MPVPVTAQEARDRHYAKTALTNRMLGAMAIFPLPVNELDLPRYAQEVAEQMVAWRPPPDVFEVQTLGQIAQVLTEMKENGITKDSILYCIERVFFE